MKTHKPAYIAGALIVTILSPPAAFGSLSGKLALHHSADLESWTMIEITPEMIDEDGRLALAGLPAPSFFRLEITDFTRVPVPEGFSLIPAGTFAMGDHFDEPEEWMAWARPVHDVYVSAFYMAQTPVTYGEWETVYDWAVANGYSFDNPGQRGAYVSPEPSADPLPDTPENNLHPVVWVGWHDVVKWCNAKSEMEGLEPVYYTDSAHTSVYREGQHTLASAHVDWTANGYRLPTEAEWEKAARGGLVGKRWPWGDAEIDGTRANYWDSGETNGTTPVGSYAPNGYGLHDMAGNVWEWTWDWFAEDWYSQPEASAPDTRGPAFGHIRVLRGGAYSHGTEFCQVARRTDWPALPWINYGFRVARSVVTVEKTRVIALSGELDFGSVAVGASAARTLTISNTGTHALTVAGMAFPDGFSGEWSGTIPAGESEEVAILFFPEEVGDYEGMIMVDSDATAGGGAITVSGTGVIPPDGFALVPAGTFAMGDPFDEPEEWMAWARPVHDVYVSAFYMAQTPVTYGEWETVYDWAVANGYSFDNPGQRGVYVSPDPDPLPDTPENNLHPVVWVGWHDVVKWCNAKSEMEGLEPVYYTDSAHTSVYREGQHTLASAHVDWTANGYRLPTEAEWEKAARGGLVGKRWPWGDAEIDGTRANYWDSGETNGTTPVGSYAPNGYGLYDMAGNVWEWTWDWFAEDWYSQPEASAPDTRGPAFGDIRVLRGGAFSHGPEFCQVARRTDWPALPWFNYGFRVARSVVTVEETRVIALSGDLDFGPVAVGASATRTLTISNTGTHALAVEGMAFPDGFSGDWSGTIPAGESEEVEVVFLPVDERDYEGMISVESDATTGFGSIAVSGTGVIPPEGFSLVPAGTFSMGDHKDEPEFWMAPSRPVHDVYVSAFYMAQTPVTYAEWKEVYDWAVANGYTFDNPGQRGSDSNENTLPDTPENNEHPVTMVNWYDVVKWCNAKSERDGLTPVYHTNDARTAVYRQGRHDMTITQVSWSANGYRLPTEAEWEKAARGGLVGKRWPWGDAEIDGTLANYRDSNETNGTTPVGSYPANGYGLYDMAGNVLEYNWDWISSTWYSQSGATDANTRGPASGSLRVLRGGSWVLHAMLCRVASRATLGSGPEVRSRQLGFRPARIAVSAPEPMVLVEGGTLSTSNELDGTEVDTFYIGRFEVTWGEWKAVRAWGEANGYEWPSAANHGSGSEPSGCADDHPVHSVNWYDVLKWSNARSEMKGLTPVYTVDGEVYRSGELGGWDENWNWVETGVVEQSLSASGYRLPLEAEWEFAARGGNQTNGYTYAGSDDLDAVGWYLDNSGGAACDIWEGHGTWPVGQKAANELGLYDMSGNVWEWCWDQSFDLFRLKRGGTWASSAKFCSVSFRAHTNPDSRINLLGFRLARSHVSVQETRVIALSGDLDFGAVAVGGSAARTLTISNTGTHALTVTGIVSPDGFSGEWSGTIPAGDSEEVAILFLPVEEGDYGGMIMVESDATTGVASIAVSGTGTEAVPLPEGFAFIPSGTFAMGDHKDDPDLWMESARPVHDVYVSGFHMARSTVTYAEWAEVHDWAVANGYSFDNPGSRGWDSVVGHLPESPENNKHPVTVVNWYDVVKWCNARSEMEGLAPVYYTDDARTVLYREGRHDITSGQVDWLADGYRLPTEAEWEKAGRGGLVGARWPWGDAEIDGTRANHVDSNEVNGTMPVGSYPANAYGLHDMAGNVWEWTWDWFSEDWYSQPGATEGDTRGPIAGADRVFRGGSWSGPPENGRIAGRHKAGPATEWTNSGFRLARSHVGMVFVEGGTLPAVSLLGELNVDSFFIGRFEVTLAEWEEVRLWASAHGYDLDDVGEGCAEDHPVQSVNWYDVVKWCNAKSEMEGLTPVYYVDGDVYRTGELKYWGTAEPDFVEPESFEWDTAANGYRLPTEAEWEFAARGGRQSGGFAYSGSDDFDEVGWYLENSGDAECDLSGDDPDLPEGHGTWPAGVLAPNELGLHDMSGNVWEWCWDEDEYSWRSLRGGSWDYMAEQCTVATPGIGTPNHRDTNIGFRFARSLALGERTRIIGLSGDLDFGSVPVGGSATRTLIISNTGTHALTVAGMAVSSGFSGEWSGTILPGESEEVDVVFLPVQEGGYEGMIMVDSDATAGVGAITVSGMGVVPPEGFALIPAGTFSMGDHKDEPESFMASSRPVHDVYVSAFYMGRTPVTYAEWKDVYDWAVAHGYTFDNPGQRGSDSIGNTLPDTPENNEHPVTRVNWYDVLKWSNAKSEKEGLTPVYYTDDAHTTVYRQGRHDVTIAQVDWSANGYRLPTEAEWERAARGGLVGKRWPWGDAEIDGTRANYRDSGGENGTTPVGSYAANGYGLYDMAGNVWEWNWDWFSPTWYSQPDASEADTRGPVSGSYRVIRGGSWNSHPVSCRVAYRYRYRPDYRWSNFGFRLARTQ